MEVGPGVPYLSFEADLTGAGAEHVVARLDGFAGECHLDGGSRDRLRQLVSALAAVVVNESRSLGGPLQVEADLAQDELQVVLTLGSGDAPSELLSRLNDGLADVGAQATDFRVRCVLGSEIEIWIAIAVEAEAPHSGGVP